MVNNKLSNLIYLFLLIEDNDYINYEYSLDLIKNIYKLLKKEKSKIKKVLLSKVIVKLILNYEYYNYDDEVQLNEIEKYINENNITNINNIKEYISDLNKYKDYEIKIDKIYSDIISKLIKTNKIDDKEYTSNLIKELDLENMNITETMFDEIKTTLDENSQYLEKYTIKNISDLNDDNIINFFYILFKYILKLPIYIYLIPFLLKTKKKIIKLIKTNKLNYINNENFEYVFNFITDTKYYKEKVLNKTKIINKSSNSNQTIFSTKKKQYLNKTINNNNNYCSITKFKNIIKGFKEKSEIIIREMVNGNIIIGGSEDNIYIFDKELKNLIEIVIPMNIKIKTDKLETEINSRNYKNTEEFKSLKKGKDVIETNKSKLENKEDFIQILFCSKYSVILYTLSSFKNKKKFDKLILEFPCSECFEIIYDNDRIEYIFIGEKGIRHYNSFKDFPSKKNKPAFEDNKLAFIEGIKINNKYLALTSNSVTTKGEDILVFYDIEKKTIIRPEKEIKYSFNTGANSLLLTMLKDDKEILLCACKKYTSAQKNGILIIEPVIKEKKDIYCCFLETNEFEVNCFCPITKKENNKIIPTNYFLVGGYDTEKGEGLIKLYNIKPNINESNEFSCIIEYLQDIIIDNTNDIDGFNGTVNCITQSKTNRDLLISCWDGKVYRLSEPNISYYLADENYSNDSFYNN